MSSDEKLRGSLHDIAKSLRTFIEYTMEEDDKSWAAWVSSVAKKIPARCWEKKSCSNMDCPAYKSECGRCWLIAGSKCLCVAQEVANQAIGNSRCFDCEIYLANTGDDPYSEIQEYIIALVHNFRSRQIELKDLATHDQLTNLKNRHFFDIYMFHEMEKLKRGNVKEMAILMMDVNDFKVINDKWGHVAGDYVLNECATILTNSIRSADVLFRFGGDEFLVVMAAAGEKESEILVQRITDNFGNWNGGKNKYGIKLSISIGAAFLNGNSDLLEVIDQADRNMYEAKQKHKKRISPPGPSCSEMG